MLLVHTSLLAQDGPKKVVAESGDGIFLLLRKNGLDPARYFQAFLELNAANIGKDNSLYTGRTYLLPPAAAAPETLLASTAAAAAETKPVAAAPEKAPAPAPKAELAVLDVPLFGKKYSRLEVRDQQLKGAVYYLTAGHGGPDPGAIGKYGPYELSEDEYAYDVTIRLARRLMEHGATVYMIVQDEDDGIRDESLLPSDKDEVCYPRDIIPLSQKERLRQRTNAVNALYLKHKGAYQRMLAVHVDSRSKGQNIDVFFYHHENSPHGKRLAETIHQTFTDKYNHHQPNRNYYGNVSTRSSLYVIKYSHPPAVFIELGNIKNDLDQRRFVLADNRQALANWIADGMISDYIAR
ncbi:N-acetylmuramoyl-L-alanine amidase [Cesiribacter sp. SM1]|uniref:N-acetylmuramoyl-L-alanine amidase family protein n=1 Tax=Cesiribacter sp. SM1 TaxID=2861196 RepID=UPI001CD67AFC|nr:N-acetylmuramoyl-L-alanine amidase [Cesiribacter sp. SM1]